VGNRYDRAVRPSQCPVGEVQDQDLETLPAGNGEHLRTRYDTILSTAEAGNLPRPRRPGTRGRVTQSPAGNLMRRLRERRSLRESGRRAECAPGRMQDERGPPKAMAVA